MCSKALSGGMLLPTGEVNNVGDKELIREIMASILASSASNFAASCGLTAKVYTCGTLKG